MPGRDHHVDVRIPARLGRRMGADNNETAVGVGIVDDVMAIADGCIVGSSLKVDGDTWKPVDPDRAADFMARARRARGER